MARLTGQQRRKREEEKRNRIIRKPGKGDTKKVKIKGRTRTRYYDGKKWVDKAVYKGTPKLSKIEQRTEELRIRNRANEELLAKNRAELAVKGASRNWDNPVGDELYLEDHMEPTDSGFEGKQPNPTTIANLQATNKYKAEKFDKERYAGWASEDIQKRKEQGMSTTPGWTEWTTDQKASDLAIPSDKQDQSGMGKDVKPIGAYNPDTGGVTWGTDKKYPLTIGGKKTSQIQRKLIDAGHNPTKLAELMRKHKNKYGNRGFLGIGGR